MNTLLYFYSPHGIIKTRTFFAILLLSFFFFSSDNSKAQGPGSLFVYAGPDITEKYGNGKGCVDITATFLETFEAINYVNEWQGQDKNGNELPTGTYFYVIDFM